MKEQKNDYLLLALQTILYGITLFYVASQFVYPGEVMRFYLGGAMIFSGAITLASVKMRRWKVQGYLLMLLTLCWTLVTIQYFIQFKASSGWVLSLNVVMYSIRLLWKGDWREH